jgi:hypothetical protein
MRSGGRCAFPECRRVLTVAAADERLVVVGEMAHIIGESPSGPRGESAMPLAERNRYENLVLLCNTHHQLVDSHPKTWPVERLHALKNDHEKWVDGSLGLGRLEELPAAPRVVDTVYSTLLPVEALPPYVFSAPCGETEADVKARVGKFRPGEVAPFIVRAGELHVFQDLREHSNPFVAVADPGGVKRTPSPEWWASPDRMRWFVELLNRTMNKLTGRRQLQLERGPTRNRFYFARGPVDQENGERKERYRPPNRDNATRKVVWQPRSRLTQQAHGYWIHRAVTLRFLHFGESNWALSVRPEIKVTADGVAPLSFEKNTRAINRIISRWFNDKYLGEVHFWRDYLSESKSRITLSFGTKPQQLRISTNLAEATIDWLGIPPEYARPFANAQYVDEEEDPPLEVEDVAAAAVPLDGEEEEAAPHDDF